MPNKYFNYNINYSKQLITLGIFGNSLDVGSVDTVSQIMRSCLQAIIGKIDNEYA